MFYNFPEPSMVQPVVQQFEVPNFDIHEDRSITMAINTKKKQEVTDTRTIPEDKENANKFTVPATVPAQNVCIISLFIILLSSIIYFLYDHSISSPFTFDAPFVCAGLIFY